MDIIAHRAGKKFNPENSLKAIKYSSKYASNIEIDVRRCKSGEIVVIHDPVVEH